MIVEEFAPKEIRHIVDEGNAVADCLVSRLEIEHWDFDPIKTEVPKPIFQYYCNILQTWNK